MINPDQDVKAIAIQLEEYDVKSIQRLMQAIALYVEKSGIDNRLNTTVQ